jgi:hypothetical protein
MKRITLQPEKLLAWLTILGLSCYVTSWIWWRNILQEIPRCIRNGGHQLSLAFHSGGCGLSYFQDENYREKKYPSAAPADKKASALTTSTYRRNPVSSQLTLAVVVRSFASPRFHPLLR